MVHHLFEGEEGPKALADILNEIIIKYEKYDFSVLKGKI